MSRAHVASAQQDRGPRYQLLGSLAAWSAGYHAICSMLCSPVAACIAQGPVIMVKGHRPQATTGLNLIRLSTNELQ